MASVQNQIDSNAAYAKKLQEEEMNFGFKPDFDTQGNSNLAKRIGIAESTGSSEEDIQVILADHDYKRSYALKPKVQSQDVVSSETPSRSTGSSSSCRRRKYDRPSRPDKTQTKVVKKAEEKTSLVEKLINHLPTIMIIILLSVIVYKMFNTPMKGSKGKGKGKGKGRKK